MAEALDILLAVMRLKHLGRLVGDVARYSVSSGAWWLVPFMVMLGVLAVVVVTSQAAVPYAVYTLF